MLLLSFSWAAVDTQQNNPPFLFGWLHFNVKTWLALLLLGASLFAGFNLPGYFFLQYVNHKQIFFTQALHSRLTNNTLGSIGSANSDSAHHLIKPKLSEDSDSSTTFEECKSHPLLFWAEWRFAPTRLTYLLQQEHGHWR